MNEEGQVAAEELTDVPVAAPERERKEKQEAIAVVVANLVHTAARRQDGIIMAVENGYSLEPASVSDVFLKVDAESAHNPNATFRNAELDCLLDDALLPTVGVLEDNESAMRTAFARERVIAYATCKASALRSAAVSANPNEQQRLKEVVDNVGTRLREAESAIMNGTRAATKLDASERLACEIESALPNGPDGVTFDDPSEGALEARQAKVGTERFVSFVFPPPDHSVLMAAGAVHSGLRTAKTQTVYPAYVTVHNAKGCIEALPATHVERRPNSFMVADAASMLYDLHALSCGAGRDHVLITHSVDV